MIKFIKISTFIVGFSIISNFSLGKSFSLIEFDSLSYELVKNYTLRSEILIPHSAYTVGYNADWKIPNWVAYVLTGTHLNGQQCSRNDCFKTDPQLSKLKVVANSRISNADYNKSGYDRGHMAPAADMRWDTNIMIESFFMTNICPQAPSLNRIYWENLEETTRFWAKKYDSIYVVCGPIISNPTNCFSKKNIVIPAAFFKALLRHDKSGWHAIAFILDNFNEIQHFSEHAISIDNLELLTGLDFFYNLPDDIENKVEASFSLNDWPYTEDNIEEILPAE